MKIRTFVSGPIMTNAFLVADEATKEALLVDAPPDVTAQVSAAVAAGGLHLGLLVITHAHWDHIGAAQELVETFGLQVLAHPLSVPQLEAPRGGPVPIAPVSVDRLLQEGDEVSAGGLSFQVLHTPGHAKGQISLYSAADHVLLGGDTLFPNGYGRTDIAGASEQETVATMARLLDLPDDVVVYPGHGDTTTIGRERAWMVNLTGSTR